MTINQVCLCEYTILLITQQIKNNTLTINISNINNVSQSDSHQLPAHSAITVSVVKEPLKNP